ncbi:MAG TPA: sensor histidine kinase [Thermoanaerobaculia bacterium]|jgi:signal transduction histidine kinase|nr:sensor histidine kinase [Thermoanaerobaculia bacterium]
MAIWRDTELSTEGSGAQGWRPGERLARLSVEVLLWAMSLFCGTMGAALLIAPHHFQTPPYRTLLLYDIQWGTLALASGVGLLAVAVLRPRRWVALGVHALAGLTLLALATSFARVGGVTGAVVYAVLGLGTALGGLLPRGRTAADGNGDLFGFLMGVVAIVAGLLMVVAPGLFRSSVYTVKPLHLTLLGLVLLLSGPLLAYADLGADLRRRESWAIHLVAGAAFLLFGLLLALPGRAWTGLALYCGGGAVVAVQPWLRRWLAALDTSSLRARLSLALAIASSVTLVLATALATAQEERLAKEQALAVRGIEAQAIARSVSDYIEMNGARTLAIAALAGRAPLTAEAQETLLGASRRSYPDVSAFRTLGLDGGVIAAAGAPLPSQLLRRLAAMMGEEREPRIQVMTSQVDGRSLLFLGAPVRDATARLAGLLVTAYDSEALGERIARPGSSVWLNDGHGQPIASRDALPPDLARLPRLPDGWDRQAGSGRVLKRESGVVGFARVPGVGWVVAVERPQAVDLAGVRRGRDVAFGLLLALIPLAVAGGILAARRIALPLQTLSDAVDELTAGNLAAPLGDGSRITEVARLSAAFREMRDRLAARTRESERLAAELRARAEALAEADRRKNEFLAMLAHELRNPLGAIANASYLLEQLGPSPAPMAKSVAIIRRQIQHLVRLVDDLLDVSRITRGKVELRREPLDLREVVGQAVDTTRPLAEAKSQSLRLHLSPEPLPLLGDATRLEQVLSNLLRNAVKFTEPGGHIDLTAGRGATGEAVVRVRDDGIGMAADLLPRVFDLFAQGEQALDREGAGLGIGLTLVRSLVEMHGGRVAARSDGPGRGSELEVRLPLAPF